MTHSIIQGDNLPKSYLMGKVAISALRGVTMNVKRGEMLCLRAPSGYRKNTPLTLLGGLGGAGWGAGGVWA